MNTSNPILKFVLKCSLVCIVIMFGSMISGELFIRSSLFNNFISSPQLWGWVSLETAISIIPISLIGATTIYNLKEMKKSRLLIYSFIVWFSLYMLLAIIYKIAIIPNSSNLSLLKPEVVWGWIIPGTLTLSFQVWLSAKTFGSTSENSALMKIGFGS